MVLINCIVVGIQKSMEAMKKGLTIAAALIYSSVALGQKTDWQRFKLKGEVASVTELEYAAQKLGKAVDKGELKSKTVYLYNDSGYRTGFTSYGADGVLTSRSEYNYNDSGRLVDVKRYRGDGGLNVTTTYKYDKLGNESEERNTDPSGLMFMSAKGKYDLNGNRIVYDRFDQFGHLFLKSNLRYDKNGNEIEEREYDSHESLQFKTSYEYSEYDSKGNWQRRVMYKNEVPKIIVERKLEYKK